MNCSHSKKKTQQELGAVAYNIHGAAEGFTTYCDFLHSSQGKDNSDVCDSETLQWQELHAIWPKLITNNWTKIYTSYHMQNYMLFFPNPDPTWWNGRSTQHNQGIHNRGFKWGNQERIWCSTCSHNIIADRRPTTQLKTTAIKAAETFCYRFSMHAGIRWTDTKFFYTAYTGLAASAFGGSRTIVKASGMWSKGVSDEQKTIGVNAESWSLMRFHARMRVRWYNLMLNSKQLETEI